MIARLLFGTLVALSMITFATADEPKEKPAKPRDKVPAYKSPAADADVDRRLAEMENHVAALLKEVQSLRQEVRGLAQAREPSRDMKIYTLKYASANNTARLLQELLGGKDGQQVKIGADQRTNQLFVSGRRDVTDLVEAILARVDVEGDSARPVEKRSVPFREKTVPKEPSPNANSWTERLEQLASALESLRERAEWAERMAKKGFLPQGEAESEQKRVQQALELLDKAKQEYRKLTGDDKKPMPEPEKPKK